MGHLGRRGATRKWVGQVKFYPYEKGVGKSSCHADGGGGRGCTKSSGVVFKWNLEVLVRLNGGCKEFPRGGGARNVCSCLAGNGGWGGGTFDLVLTWEMK